MRAADRLLRQLDRAALALTTGDLVTLGRLVPDIEEALARLPDETVDAPTAASLRAAALRADSLIRAADQGLRDARKRLADIAAVRASLTTYDRAGRHNAHRLGTAMARRV